MNKMYVIPALCFVLGATMPVVGKDEPEQKTSLPPFEELYELVRSHVKSLNPEQLNRAAVRGLLQQLSADVIMVTNGIPTQPPAAAEWVTAKAIHEEAYGYIRIGQVEPGLAKQVQDAYQQLLSTNKLKGLVLDLRFSSGQDYNEVGRVADLFIEEEKVLLEFGDTTVRSTAKTEPIATPLVVLVNERTTGAAEALAAVMRQSAGSLVIGKLTAGRARTFQEFALANGQKVKLAIGKIRLPDGNEVPVSGLNPDVPVLVSEEEELAYLAEPYRNIPRKVVGSAADPLGTGTNNVNRLRRPRNESELIRLRREGLDLESDLPEPATEEPSKPVLHDPALARGVDFLKGLALVQKRK